MASSVSRRNRYQTDPEYRARRLKQAASYRAKNPHKYREWQRMDRARNPEKWRELSRRAQGLPTPTRPQPEACEICGLRPTISLCLDHDHSTGEFRGWICSGCNVGLGHFRDDPITLEQAAKYLRAHRA